jgi:hypothetical protein
VRSLTAWELQRSDFGASGRGGGVNVFSLGCTHTRRSCRTIRDVIHTSVSCGQRVVNRCVFVYSLFFFVGGGGAGLEC